MGVKRFETEVKAVVDCANRLKGGGEWSSTKLTKHLRKRGAGRSALVEGGVFAWGATLPLSLSLNKRILGDFVGLCFRKDPPQTGKEGVTRISTNQNGAGPRGGVWGAQKSRF